MKLLEWIKANLKEGADISEAEKLIAEENPISGLRTNDEALELIKSNKLLNGALDAETSRRAENAIEKFEKEKLPKLLTEKEEEIRKEIDKPLTAEQKRIAELEKKVQDAENEKKSNSLKASLRAKAKELAEKAEIPYDPLQAERFSVFENAEEMLISDIDYHKKNITSVLEKKLKTQFTPGEPKKTAPEDIKTRLKKAQESGNVALAFDLQRQLREE